MAPVPSPPTLEPPANITRGGGAKRGASLLVDMLVDLANRHRLGTNRVIGSLFDQINLLLERVGEFGLVGGVVMYQ